MAQEHEKIKGWVYKRWPSIKGCLSGMVWHGTKFMPLDPLPRPVLDPATSLRRALDDAQRMARDTARVLEVGDHKVRA